jgi:hypothetical protein
MEQTTPQRVRGLTAPPVVSYCITTAPQADAVAAGRLMMAGWQADLMNEHRRRYVNKHRPRRLLNSPF